MKPNNQLTHADHNPSGIKHPLQIIANDINSPQNIGSLFRLCDALAIERLHLCGDTPAPPNAKITKTSRSAEKHVTYERHANAEEVVNTLKKSGTFIISLEITCSSIAIDSTEFSDTIKAKINKKTPICLILGSENSGICETLLSLSDLITHITMLGNNSSMNVISAASIACFEITREM